MKYESFQVTTRFRLYNFHDPDMESLKTNPTEEQPESVRSRKDRWLLGKRSQTHSSSPLMPHGRRLSSSPLPLRHLGRRLPSMVTHPGG
ncbi:unnamed protein product [Rhodiola kirilowii]